MEGGVIKLAADLRDDVVYEIESPPLLSSEGLPVINLEADTPDEIVRAGFGEKLVAGVQQLLEEGRGRELGEVALTNEP